MRYTENPQKMNSLEANCRPHGVTNVWVGQASGNYPQTAHGSGNLTMRQRSAIHHIDGTDGVVSLYNIQQVLEAIQ